jgi:hypothetical protein
MLHQWHVFECSWLLSTLFLSDDKVCCAGEYRAQKCNHKPAHTLVLQNNISPSNQEDPLLAITNAAYMKIQDHTMSYTEIH